MSQLATFVRSIPFKLPGCDLCCADVQTEFLFAFVCFVFFLALSYVALFLRVPVRLAGAWRFRAQRRSPITSTSRARWECAHSVPGRGVWQSNGSLKEDSRYLNLRSSGGVFLSVTNTQHTADLLHENCFYRYFSSSVTLLSTRVNTLFCNYFCNYLLFCFFANRETECWETRLFKGRLLRIF